MKKIVLASLALAAMIPSGWAVAADMPLKAPPPPVVVDLWSGFYLGGNVGYSWGRWSSTSINNGAFLGPAGFTNTANPNVTGAVGGVQVGVNKLYGQWLVGLEADIQASGERANSNGTFTTPIIGAGTLSISELAHWSLPWFATFRGRIGVVAADSWLLYATGGLAVGRTVYDHTSSATLGGVTATLFASEGTTRAGAAVGAGVEKAIDAHWRAKAEFLYLDFGSHTFITGSAFDTNVRLRDYIARVGLNYRIPPN